MPGFRRLRQGRGEEAEAESGRVGADGAAAGAEEGHGQVQAHLRGIHDEALQGGPHGDGKAANLTLNKLKFGPNYVIYSEDGIYPISAVLLFTFEDCKPIQSIQKTIQNGIESTL